MSISLKTLKILQILFLNLDTRYTANLLFYDGGIYLEGQLYGSDYPLETLWRVWDTQVYGINCIQPVLWSIKHTFCKSYHTCAKCKFKTTHCKLKIFERWFIFFFQGNLLLDHIFQSDFGMVLTGNNSENDERNLHLTASGNIFSYFKKSIKQKKWLSSTIL